MKKTIAAVMLLSLTIATTNYSHAVIIPDDPKPKTELPGMTDAEKTARAEQIRARVAEIRAMDKSSLSKAERKALRKELKEMNKEAKAMKGGVYLSVGAIIIIILVLILIL